MQRHGRFFARFCPAAADASSAHARKKGMSWESLTALNPHDRMQVRRMRQTAAPHRRAGRRDGRRNPSQHRVHVYDAETV